MKFIPVIASALALLSSPAAARDFSCQYYDSNGFFAESDQWVRTGFALQAPFIIRLGSNGAITNGEEIIGYGTKCSKSPDRAYNQCHDGLGSSLAFNSDYARGSLSFAYGSMFPPDDGTDTISMNLFACEIM